MACCHGHDDGVGEGDRINLVGSKLFFFTDGWFGDITPCRPQLVKVVGGGGWFAVWSLFSQQMQQRTERSIEGS